MWVMLPKGALSITMSHREPGRMQVRSRRKEWLDAFREYCPELGPDIHLEHADYQWRALADPEHIAEAMKRVTLAIDYSNFKSEAGDPRKGLKNAKLRTDYVGALHSIWSTLLKAGDGTSGYQGLGKSSHHDSGTIDICARLGHWWKGAGRNKRCQDCDVPYRKNITKPTAAEVDAWWAAHPGLKRPKAAVPPVRSCPGGTRRPVAGTSRLVSTRLVGECSACHTEQPISSDSMGVIRWHPVPVAEEKAS